MSTERRESLQQGQSINISNELDQAIELAAARLGETKKVLGPADLLSAIVVGDNFGKFVLEGLAGQNAKFPQFQKELGRISQTNDPDSSISGNINRYDQNTPINSSLKSLIKEASRLANGSCVDTAHIIEAEANRTDSILLKAFKDAGQDPKNLNIVFTNWIKSLRVKGRQDNTNLNCKIIIKQTEISSQDNIDLLQEAKNGKYKTIEVKDSWLKKLYRSISTKQIAVVQSDYLDEVQPLVQAFADGVSEDSNLQRKYASIIAPELSALEADTDGTLVNAVADAEGGILILPAEARFLEHKSIALALRQKRTKLIVYASKDQWRQEKISFQTRQQSEIVTLDAYTVDETISFLNTQKKSMEEATSQTTKIKISDDSLKQASTLASQFQTTLGLPVQLGAKSLIESAISLVQAAGVTNGRLKEKRIPDDKEVNPSDIVMAFQDITAIDYFSTLQDKDRILHADKFLGKRVVGQEDAIKALVDALVRAKSGLKDPNKPIGSFIFLGSSGVGKTELAKALAEFLFTDENAIVRIDMSEYQEKNSVARLTGAPPGYVGYEEGGQLTEPVKTKPYRVVLLDEIEKAHPEVWNVFLQVLDDGRLTDGKGTTVDFKNTVVIMTSNLGSGTYKDTGKTQEEHREDIMEAVGETFRPEFINRFDELVVFKPLTPDSLLGVTDLQIAKLNKLLASSGAQLEVTPEVRKLISTTGYNPAEGGRPVGRAVNRLIKTPLAVALLEGNYTQGDVVVASLQDGKIVFSKK